jgi:hypothetical protein
MQPLPLDGLRSKWRREARAHLNLLVTGCSGSDTDRKALSDQLHFAYPWGKRRGWPYQAWLLEVRLLRTHLGLLPPVVLKHKQQARRGRQLAAQLEAAGQLRFVGL